MSRARLPQIRGPLFLRPEDAIVQEGGSPDVHLRGLAASHPTPVPDHAQASSEQKPAELPYEHQQLVVLGAMDRIAQTMDRVARLLERQFSRDAEVTEVNADIAPQNLLEASRFRHGGTIYNDSSAVLYVKLGPYATTDSFTVKLNGGDYYELPYGYAGVISGVWATATGSARVTELS